MQTTNDTPAVWICTQPSLFKRIYELKENESGRGTLRYASWPPGAAKAGNPQGLWDFRRIVWYRSAIGIWEPGFELPFAKYTANMFGRHGVVELPKGERLEYDRRIWRGTYSFLNQFQQPVISFNTARGWKKRGDITILREGEETVKNYPWLPLFLMYLVISQQQHQH